MRLRPISLLICLFFAALTLHANPENILVDKYTFTRPQHWKWRAPGEKWSALSRFQISADDAQYPTEARFYIISADNSDVRKRVLSNFRKPVQETIESTKIRDVELIYFTGKGTAVDKDTKQDPRPDHQFTGIILPTASADKFVFVRLFGPRPEVEAAMKDFKAMVEQAVRDSQ